jgi:hypothetical protein
VDAEDLVENSRDEQSRESDDEDEQYWIDHPTRILRRHSQRLLGQDAESKYYFNQVIRVTGT